MNSLSKFIEEKALNELDAMNLLQGYGVVSDLCINANEVDESDCEKAIDFIERFISTHV